MIGKRFNQYSIIGKAFAQYSMTGKRYPLYSMIGKRFAQYSINGSLTYEKKFSLDAKPIEGGVCVVVVIVVAFESDSFSLPTDELCNYSTKERDRKSSIFSKRRRRRSPRMKRERETNL